MRSAPERKRGPVLGRPPGRGGRRLGGRLGAPLSLVLILRCPQAEQELRVAQTEFDRQAEVTRLLLEGISSTHVSPAPSPPPVPHILLSPLMSPLN